MLSLLASEKDYEVISCGELSSPVALVAQELNLRESEKAFSVVGNRRLNFNANFDPAIAPAHSRSSPWAPVLL
jgi:hypothetical protein